MQGKLDDGHRTSFFDFDTYYTLIESYDVWVAANPVAQSAAFRLQGARFGSKHSLGTNATITKVYV